MCELRDLHELESRERTEDYQRELADWKVYEKTRVCHLSLHQCSNVCCTYNVLSLTSCEIPLLLN